MGLTLALSASGIRDEPRRANAELGKCRTPLRVRVRSEHQSGVGMAMQPAIELEFVLHLARAPARVAECEKRLLRSSAFGDGAQDVQRRRKRYVLRDGKR